MPELAARGRCQLRAFLVERFLPSPDDLKPMHPGPSNPAHGPEGRERARSGKNATWGLQTLCARSPLRSPDWPYSEGETEIDPLPNKPFALKSLPQSLLLMEPKLRQKSILNFHQVHLDFFFKFKVSKQYFSIFLTMAV